ncbi:MAG: tetratricopeptide repeat protein [Betaproteobacteria bacterium]|nr:tetratricopeptide repeat protein [Betaproteobacteria bacterium]
MSTPPNTIPLPIELDMLLREAQAAISAMRFQDALEIARVIGFKAPQSGMGPFLCGYAQQHMGMVEDAQRSYHEAVRLDRHHPDFQFHLALLEMNLGLLDSAMKRFQEVLRLDPRLDGAQVNIGAIHARKGDRAAAVRAFQRALLINGQSVPAHNSIAEIALAEGALSDSLDHANAALRISPQDVPALFTRAQVHELRGEDAEARANFEMIVTIDPTHATALTRLAMQFFRIGKLEDARACIDRALELAPDQGYAVVARAVIYGETPATLPAAMVAAVFDQFSAAYDRHMTGNLQYAAPQMTFDLLGDWLAGKDAPAALDLGCGTGLFGALLKPRVGVLKGVDISPGMLSEAAPRGLYDELAQGHMLAYLLSQEPAAFDLVTAVDVFIYVGALEEIFAEVARVLRPGGAFGFTIETTDTAELGYVLMASGRYRHTHAYIEKLATHHGLTVAGKSDGVLRVDAGEAQAGSAYSLQKPAG